MARMCHNVSAGRRGRNYHKDYIYYFSTHRMLSSNHSMRYKFQLTLINLIVYIHQQGFPLIKTIFAQELVQTYTPCYLQCTHRQKLCNLDQDGITNDSICPAYNLCRIGRTYINPQSAEFDGTGLWLNPIINFTATCIIIVICGAANSPHAMCQI